MIGENADDIVHMSTQNTVPSKASFMNEGEIKTFQNKQILKEFVTTCVALQKILTHTVN